MDGKNWIQIFAILLFVKRNAALVKLWQNTDFYQKIFAGQGRKQGTNLTQYQTWVK